MNFLENIWILAVVCSQWGDTGKGKLSDYFASWADVIARGTGGPNAGHGVWAAGQYYGFHQLPCGILHPDKINIIGNGMVLDPRTLLEEMRSVENYISPASLRIAYNANVILPQHRLIESLRESGKDRIGTTGRGIGPAYEDHYRRMGLIINDLLNPDIFREKLKRNLEEKIRIFRSYDPDLIKEIMFQLRLEEGRYYCPKNYLNIDAIISAYIQYGQELCDFIQDTDVLIRSYHGKKRVFLEGSQGLLLSIKDGTYPFVTSCDVSHLGLAKGVGLSPKDIDRTIVIAKAFYMTRVGDGPFPTELGGKESAEWCATSGMNQEGEAEAYPDITLDEKDDLRLGVAIRQAGDEYGATTGRPRRCGWLDLPLLRYARGILGRDFALTKLDVLNHCPRIKVCTHYVYDGPDYHLGQTLLRKGDTLTCALPYSEILRHCKPVYKEYPGWMEDIGEAKSKKDLPIKLLDILKDVERSADIEVNLLSIGRDREQTIFIQ